MINLLYVACRVAFAFLRTVYVCTYDTQVLSTAVDISRTSALSARDESYRCVPGVIICVRAMDVQVLKPYFSDLQKFLWSP